MKYLLRLEEFGMMILGIYFLTFHGLNIVVWIWIFIFFSPDVGMLGYLVSPKVGAITYNLFHLKGIAIALIGIGYFTNAEVLVSLGVLLFAHASFDRAMGYGLKHYTSFNDTHLGKLKEDNKDRKQATLS